eukprot:3097713-Amphidinium_carterae.1
MELFVDPCTPLCVQDDITHRDRCQVISLKSLEVCRGLARPSNGCMEGAQNKNKNQMEDLDHAINKARYQHRVRDPRIVLCSC